MVGVGRLLLSTVAALGLTACSYLEGVSGAFNVFGCSSYAGQVINAVNWDTSRVLNMRIRQGEYRPMILGLTARRPYVLRIQNADDTNRIFRAGEFFSETAVGLVRINGIDTQDNCISAITMGPRETAEVWFVAMRDGRYEFEDQAIPFMFSEGASGVIHVSMARPRHVSPVSHLIVPEAVPTAPILAPSPRSRVPPQPPAPVASPRANVTPGPALPPFVSPTTNKTK